MHGIMLPQLSATVCHFIFLLLFLFLLKKIRYRGCEAIENIEQYLELNLPEHR